MKFTDQAGPPANGAVQAPSEFHGTPSSVSRYHLVLGVFSLERCDEYRRFAEACIELAHHQKTPQERAVLLQMALIWSRLPAACSAGTALWPSIHSR